MECYRDIRGTLSKFEMIQHIQNLIFLEEEIIDEQIKKPLVIIPDLIFSILIFSFIPSYSYQICLLQAILNQENRIAIV